MTDRPTAERIRRINRSICGGLVLEYESRTVTVADIDGDVAMRVLAASVDVAEGRHPRLMDVIDPRRTLAVYGHFTVSFGERLLVARWIPRDIEDVQDIDMDAADVAASPMDDSGPEVADPQDRPDPDAVSEPRPVTNMAG